MICQKPRERVVTDLTHKTWDLGSMLAEPSYAVERILQTKPNQLVILTPQELEQYIFDELFQRTKNNQGDATPEYILSLQYIAKNIANAYQQKISPYVYDAIEEGDYKQAGDNAVFGYIHFVSKRKNPLSKEDYIHLAEQCYYRWYQKQPNSLGFIIASNVSSILLKIQNWSTDMMQRVPAFSVVGR